jgi:GTP-binding protein EngB required for normal cell division
MSGKREFDPMSVSTEENALSLAASAIEDFHLSDLQPLLRAVQQQQHKQELNVAVLGGFKAGKSSFLNHFIGRPLLPVGVLPVTAIVTEISYGPREYAEVVFFNAQALRINVTEIGNYISESENPQNVKAVDSVRLFLPALEKFRGVRFVDTPGMQSVFEHNTQTVLSWTPNVDLAIVAVAVDPPLTQQDVNLIEQLHQYTPNIAILLTKADILSLSELEQVEGFVHAKLHDKFGTSISVFPYSIKPGYETLRSRFETERIVQPLASAHQHHRAVLLRKLGTLLRSAENYLDLILKASETAESQRQQLAEQVLGSQKFLADQKMQLQLLARHSAGKTRKAIESYLQQNLSRELQKRLQQRLGDELPNWRGGFAAVLSAFENWLCAELTQELTAISTAHQQAFSAPLREVEGQCQRNLQAFRDQLSQKITRLFGVELHTTETEIEIQTPRSPDVSVGKVFDHSWELISFLLPMPLVRWAVERRFYERVEREVYKNLSRLTTQWEERVQKAIFAAAQEAEHRHDELLTTVNEILTKQDRSATAEVSACLIKIREALEQLPASSIY